MALIGIVRGLPSSDMGHVSDHFWAPLKIQILWGERYLVGGLEPWNWKMFYDFPYIRNIHPN